MKSSTQACSTTMTLFAAMAIRARLAAHINTVVNFSGLNGAYPKCASLVHGTNSNRYGTTPNGGVN